MFVDQGSGAGDHGAGRSRSPARSYRYNNLQIDGAVNNDLFGLARSAGTPGGAAEHAADQPRRDPGNAARRLAVRRAAGRVLGRRHQRRHQERHRTSFHGTAFFFGRNQDWVGKGVTDTPISTFKDKQGGFSFGGPIVKNKAFFFGTLDDQPQATPTGFSVGGTRIELRRQRRGGRSRSSATCKNLYGYDAGAGSEERVLADDQQQQVLRRAPTSTWRPGTS